MMILWWKRSLTSQFIVFILAALLIGQTIAFLISSSQRETAVRQAIESDFITRTASLSAILTNVPAEMRGNVLIASSTGYSRFWLSDRDPRTNAVAWYKTAQSYLAVSIPNLIKLRNAEGRELFLDNARPSTVVGDPDISEWQPLQSQPTISDAQFMHFSNHEGMGIAQQLDNGSWLNAVSYKPMPPNLLSSQSLLSIGITALTLSLIGAAVARQIVRPLRSLAVSAEALGRGESITLSAPRAPDDIRQLYDAFDQMQLRLRRFIEDHSRMLAAIGHDLRTPLTTLRLRAEFITDVELQRKILATIDEMRSVTETTLSFTQSEATAEETRTVDLPSLLGSLCDDLAAIGQDVSFHESDRISYRCRPDNLKRAVRNLIENAVRYAGKADVKVQVRSKAIEILIEDDGPGIPAAELDQVFAPFYRIESSRNRGTGGVGLGLSIARAIVRHHGGEIMLSSNNPGLRALVILPTV